MLAMALMLASFFIGTFLDAMAMKACGLFSAGLYTQQEPEALVFSGDSDLKQQSRP